MTMTTALGLWYVAEQSLRAFGASAEVAELYSLAAAALAEVGQSYLAGLATERHGAVLSLL